VAEPIRIYLAQQPKELSLYEIYREGKPTGEMINDSIIRKILDQTQYAAFTKGELIFLIPGPRFRSRNYKKKKQSLTGKSPGNFKFK
jgi:hypothetical protein